MIAVGKDRGGRFSGFDSYDAIRDALSKVGSSKAVGSRILVEYAAQRGTRRRAETGIDDTDEVSDTRGEIGREIGVQSSCTV